MTASLIMGVALLVLGALAIWKRERIAEGAAAYFRRFGAFGGAAAKTIRPALYLIGGIVFVVIGAATILYSLVTANA